MTNTNSENSALFGAAPAVSRSDVLDAVMVLARMAQGLTDAYAVPGLSVAIVHR